MRKMERKLQVCNDLNPCTVYRSISKLIFDSFNVLCILRSPVCFHSTTSSKAATIRGDVFWGVVIFHKLGTIITKGFTFASNTQV